MKTVIQNPNRRIDLPADKQFVWINQRVVRIDLRSYKNDALAVILGFDNGETQPISINIEKHAFVLEPGEFFLKNYSELEDLAKILFERGIIKKSGGIEVPTGFVRVPICKLTPEISCLAKLIRV